MWAEGGAGVRAGCGAGGTRTACGCEAGVRQDQSWPSVSSWARAASLGAAVRVGRESERAARRPLRRARRVHAKRNTEPGMEPTGHTRATRLLAQTQKRGGRFAS